jgi:DNA-binding transcriptional MerR regulator
MTKFRIAQLAAHTGFTPATLRYYEELGLLSPPERSPAGYRLYGERDIERALFIGRAKRLGLSLEEIHSLVDVWAGGRCIATRTQLRGIVDTKIDAVRQQLDDCAVFLQQLQAVSTRLAESVEEGPGDSGCGCAPELPPIETVRTRQQATAS